MGLLTLKKGFSKLWTLGEIGQISGEFRMENAEFRSEEGGCVRKAIRSHFKRLIGG